MTYQPDAMVHLQLSDRPWLSCTRCQSPCSEISLCGCCKPVFFAVSSTAPSEPGPLDDSIPVLPAPEEEITVTEKEEAGSTVDQEGVA